MGQVCGVLLNTVSRLQKEEKGDNSIRYHKNESNTFDAMDKIDDFFTSQQYQDLLKKCQQEKEKSRKDIKNKRKKYQKQLKIEESDEEEDFSDLIDTQLSQKEEKSGKNNQIRRKRIPTQFSIQSLNQCDEQKDGFCYNCQKNTNGKLRKDRDYKCYECGKITCQRHNDLISECKCYEERQQWKECSICLTNFDDKDHKPYGLTCGHSVCKIYIKGSYDLKQIECPLCRKSTAYSDEESISQNFKLISALQTEQ